MAEHFQIVHGLVGPGTTGFEDTISRLIKEGWLLHGPLIPGEGKRELTYQFQTESGFAQVTLVEVSQAMWKPYFKSVPPR